MKYRKVTLVTTQVGNEDAGILFSPFDGLLVNDKPLRHHGFTIGSDGYEGFLVLTVLNVTEEVFNEFMANETPEDVLEGTGVPTFLTERSSSDPEKGPDELTWAYGTNIVLPIHDIELRILTRA